MVVRPLALPPEVLRAPYAFPSLPSIGALMAWTPPRTWAFGEVVDAVELNAELRDNLLLLATAPIVQPFLSGNNWSKPADAKWVLVEAIGGGGGGGGCSVTAGSGEGGYGGGGGYARKLFLASTLPSTVVVTVGLGGAGGVTGNNPGQRGGTSTFSTLSASGGFGGNGTTSSSTTGLANGGAGGSGSGGDVNVTGQPGSKGRVIAGAPLLVGTGGMSGGGFGGGALSRTAEGIGLAGMSFGGGGGAAYVSSAAFAGGVGGDGLVLVTTFFAG